MQCEARLRQDPARQQRLDADHQRYIEQRWSLLSDADRQLIHRCDLRADFDELGVAGMRDFTTVKCLHAHVAQHLVDGNAVGAMVAPELGVA